MPKRQKTGTTKDTKVVLHWLKGEEKDTEVCFDERDHGIDRVTHARNHNTDSEQDVSDEERSCSNSESSDKNISISSKFYYEKDH